MQRKHTKLATAFLFDAFGRWLKKMNALRNWYSVRVQCNCSDLFSYFIVLYKNVNGEMHMRALKARLSSSIKPQNAFENGTLNIHANTNELCCVPHRTEYAFEINVVYIF